MNAARPQRIAPPEFGAAMAPAHPSEEARRLIALRRSTPADTMTDPGPDRPALDAILEMAARVPDHRKLFPFRFIVFEGDGRRRAGDILARRFMEITPEADAARVDVERRRFERAPVVIAVVSNVDPAHKTPEWEQVLTGGAVCMNLLLAASSFGFGGNWLTEWYAYDEKVIAAFGLRPGERIAGFVYIGSASEPPRERQRPEMASLVVRF